MPDRLSLCASYRKLSIRTTVPALTRAPFGRVIGGIEDEDPPVLTGRVFAVGLEPPLLHVEPERDQRIE